MKENNLHKAGRLIFFVTLVGIFLLAGLSGAQEEDMGITVSRAPEPGWNPDVAAGRSSWISFAALSVTTLVISGWIFTMRRKSRNTLSGPEAPADQSFRTDFKPQPIQQSSLPFRQTVLDSRRTAEESASPVLQPEAPRVRVQTESPALSTVSVIKKPTVISPVPAAEQTLRQQPVQQDSSPFRRPVTDNNRRKAEGSENPVLQPETPRVRMQTGSPVLNTVSVIKTPVIIAPAPEAEQIPKPQGRNNDEEDTLIRHINLLRQLKNKES